MFIGECAECIHRTLMIFHQVITVRQFIEHRFVLGVCLEGVLQAFDRLAIVLQVLVFEGKVELDLIEALIGKFKGTLIVLYRLAIIA